MKLNIHFWNILNIALVAMFNDFIIYTTNIQYTIGIGISFLIIIISNIYLIKTKKIEITKDFDFTDIVFFSIILALFAMKISVPDFSYDVSNYHIYLQENISIDKINFDFFAGKTINGFQFPLGDRMHYIFRYFLGYRLGTILSYYSIIVLYYQTKEMITIITSSKKKKLISLCANLCLASAIIIKWIGTYYIDSFSIIFILQIIITIIQNKEIFKSKKSIYFVALLAGIATAIKLTNLLLIIPIIIMYLLKYRKTLTIKMILHYILSIIIFTIPFLLYVIDNYIQTGSPIYPYYNNIFKSEYFGFFSWKDERFGIPNLAYAAVWPIYVGIILKGYGEGGIVTDKFWGAGYVITIITIIVSIYKKKKIINDKLLEISILNIFLTIVWIAFLEGYMRYALIIPALYSIIIGSIIIKIIEKRNITVSKDILKKVITILISYIFIIIIFVIIILCYDIWNTASNYCMIFKDIKKVEIQIDGVWGVIADDSSITQMVRDENTPIYNLEKSYINTSEKTLKMYNEKIKNNDIYILIDKEKYNIKLEKLYENNFVIDEEIKKYTSEDIPFLEKHNELYLYKIKYVGE